MNLYNLLPEGLKARVWLVLVVSTLSSLLEIIGLASVGPFIQYISTQTLPFFLQDFQYFNQMDVADVTIFLGGASLILIIISGALSIASMMVVYKYAFKIGEYFSAKIMDYLLQISPTEASRKDPSIVVRDITQDANLRIIHSIFVSGVMLVSKSIVTFFIVISLLIINPTISLYVAVFFGSVYVLIYILVRKKMKSFGYVISESSSKLIGIIHDCISTVREIFIWGRAEKVSSEFKKLLAEHNQAQYSFNWIAQSPKIIVEAVTFSVLVIVCIYMSINYGFLDDFISQVTIFMIAGYRLLPAVQQIFWAISSINANQAAFVNVKKYCDTNNDIKADFDKVPVMPINFNASSFLTMKNVSVVFGSEQFALNNLSLSIKKGEKVAFIGSSGGGKTTCLNVLMGLQETTSGDVLVNEKSISNNKYNALNWSKKCSLVSQDVYILNDTLANNVTFLSDVEIDQVKIEIACKVSSLDFCELDYTLGSRGTSLSGGQKQRVGIARALYKDFEFLALDEATSSLDNEIEESILVQLFNQFSEKSVVMIIHRLHTLKHFDKIFVFDKGEIECSGDFDFIKENSKVYQRLKV
jgi:HlyD family secretion protein